MPGGRILHVITPGDHFSPLTGSAIPTVVDGLARAAARAGAPRHAVVIDRSTWHPRYDSADVIEYAGAPAPGRRGRYLDAARGRLGLPRSAVVHYFEPLAAVIRDLRPSTVIAHNAPIVPWLLRDTSHEVILYCHNDLLRTYTNAEAGRILATAAAIVCVSESLAEHTRQRLPRELVDRVRVVRNGVDAVAFTPTSSAPPTDAVPRIMFLGRVIPEKGVDVLLRAAALLPAASAEVVIVGRPGFAASAPINDYERELRRLADESSCVVHFENFVPRGELPALLRTSDIFVVPSRWPDPAPLTVGEALATGLPVVGSRIGGIPELVGDAGVLVPHDDPAPLAAALRGLIADRDRRVVLGAAARARAAEHDWSWTWRQLDAVLGGMVD